MVRAMSGAERLVAACRGEAVDRTPVWFMRQAGSCLAEYRALRERHGVLTIAKTPDLAAQVALLPVERLGVDGAVLFADIMLPLEAMGASFDLQDVGPVVHQPVRTGADVERLRVPEPEEIAPYVMDSIRIIRRGLGDRAAVIGFSGAPFTLACYLIEGRPSRDYARAKGLMFSEPETWRALLEKVTETVLRYLRQQVGAGIQVMQLFDSWMGILSPQDYERSSLPYSRRVLRAFDCAGVPRVHFGTGNAGLLELAASAGADVVGVDWRLALDDAWARIGPDRGIQGNLDPTLLLAPWPRIQEGVEDVLRRAAGRPGHVFNLGHAVQPETDASTLARVVELVHARTEAGQTDQADESDQRGEPDWARRAAAVGA